MKIFSTFTGIGGFELGIKKVFPNWNVVGYSEVSKYASAIYDYRFPNVKNYGDIAKIDFAELPEFDVLTGGVPCQAWSIAGKQKGFDDPRGKMWFYFIELLKIKQPKIFIAENVKGLIMGENIKAFKFLLSQFNEQGYVIDYHLLNSKKYGVPQNRERIYIIGIREDKLSYEFSLKDEEKFRGQNVLFPRTSGEKYEMFDRYFRGGSRGKALHHAKNDRIFTEGEKHESSPELCKTITSGYWKQRPNGTYVLNELTKKQPQGYRIYSTDGIAPTLSSEGGGIGGKTGLVKIQEGQVRKLTPIECERLQGFPDNFTKYGKFNEEIKEISDTQRYMTLGNAVTVNVIEAIFEIFKNYGLIKEMQNE